MRAQIIGDRHYVIFATRVADIGMETVQGKIKFQIKISEKNPFAKR